MVPVDSGPKIQKNCQSSEPLFFRRAGHKTPHITKIAARLQRLQRCRRDCSDVAEITEIAAMSCNIANLTSTTVQILENTPGTLAGNVGF